MIPQVQDDIKQDFTIETLPSRTFRMNHNNLTIIGTIREVLGNGSFFGITIPGYEPMAYFVRAPGAFLVLAILVAIMNASGIKNRANKMTEGCDGCCASCSSSCDKKEG